MTFSLIGKKGSMYIDFIFNSDLNLISKGLQYFKMSQSPYKVHLESFSPDNQFRLKKIGGSNQLTAIFPPMTYEDKYFPNTLPVTTIRKSNNMDLFCLPCDELIPQYNTRCTKNFRKSIQESKEKIVDCKCDLTQLIPKPSFLKCWVCNILTEYYLEHSQSEIHHQNMLKSVGNMQNLSLCFKYFGNNKKQLKRVLQARQMEQEKRKRYRNEMLKKNSQMTQSGKPGQRSQMTNEQPSKTLIIDLVSEGSPQQQQQNQ